MEALLYFPLISPPASGWLTRALLYWEKVGTIVPQGWVHEPELLGPATQELVRRELLTQVFPNQARQHRDDFVNWIDALSQEELHRRRVCFARGETVKVHRDKWLAAGSALHVLPQLGLAVPRGRPSASSWLEVERETGQEFMASLALALCHPESHPGQETRASEMSNPQYTRPFRSP